MIKLLVTDGDGTLFAPSEADYLGDFRVWLRQEGIALGVASNGQRGVILRRFADHGISPPDYIVTRADVGNKKKPSPAFVDKLMEQAGVEPRETAYIGDDERTDNYLAINSRVMPLLARYSEGYSGKYAFPISSLYGLKRFLEVFGRQPAPYFGWVCKSDNYDFRAVISQHSRIGSQMRAVLKEHRDVQVGPGMSLRPLLFYYTLSQCYLSGAHDGKRLIAVYPGSQPKRPNSTLAEFGELFDLTSQSNYLTDLLIREKPAPEQKKAGVRRSFGPQLETVRLNDAHKRRISGKSVLVLDDYTTSGVSLAVAHALLKQAGASKVIGVAIGKFRNKQRVVKLPASYDPFRVMSAGTRLEEDVLDGVQHAEADQHFYDRVISA
ncbi:MAG: HAD hydrolase-like protein [Bacteroidota bacterium]